MDETNPSMKTNEQTQLRSCCCPCCGLDTNNHDAGGGSQSGRFPAPGGHQVDWTDSLRPFLGFYVFKG